MLAYALPDGVAKVTHFISSDDSYRCKMYLFQIRINHIHIDIMRPTVRVHFVAQNNHNHFVVSR